MDLVLLQPGDANIVGDDNLVDDTWRQSGLKLEKCIELVSVHHGVKQQITTNVSNSARTSGRPNISDFTCVKYVDSSSPYLYDYCLRAQPIGVADKKTKIFILRNANTQTANLITFELTDAIISHIEFQSHPDDMPTEQIMLNFTEITWTYTAQKTDATAGGNISCSWSVAKNRPLP